MHSPPVFAVWGVACLREASHGCVEAEQRVDALDGEIGAKGQHARVGIPINSENTDI